MERTVLTTGAGTGIGLATVIELSRRGFDSVGAVRSQAKARAVSRAAHKAGVKVRTVMLDVTDAQQCEQAVDDLITTPLTGWYQASKHALEALSDALRVELASDGIAVVLIEPGAFRSNIWESASNDVRRPADSEYFTAYHRLDEGIKASQRLMGDPIEVARLIASMMTAKRPKARYLVGYDARAIDLHSKVLPTEVRDRLARLTLGL